MADVTTTKSVLQTVVEFADGDTRTINIDNPNDSLTAAQVEDWADYAQENGILIGDRTGAALTGVKSAKVIDRVQTTLDQTTLD